MDILYHSEVDKGSIEVEWAFNQNKFAMYNITKKANKICNPVILLCPPW